MTPLRCSGAMTDHGSAPDPQPVRLSVTLVRVLCAPCRDAAARLGMAVPVSVATFPAETRARFSPRTGSRVSAGHGARSRRGRP